MSAGILAEGPAGRRRYRSIANFLVQQRFIRSVTPASRRLLSAPTFWRKVPAGRRRYRPIANFLVQKRFIRSVTPASRRLLSAPTFWRQKCRRDAGGTDQLRTSCTVTIPAVCNACVSQAPERSDILAESAGGTPAVQINCELFSTVTIHTVCNACVSQAPQRAPAFCQQRHYVSRKGEVRRGINGKGTLTTTSAAS